MSILLICYSLIYEAKVGVKHLCVYTIENAAVGCFMNEYIYTVALFVDQRLCIYMFMGCGRRELGPENDRETKTMDFN